VISEEIGKITVPPLPSDSDTILVQLVPSSEISIVYSVPNAASQAIVTSLIM
jgi:hypothetical protein